MKTASFRFVVLACRLIHAPIAAIRDSAWIARRSVQLAVIASLAALGSTAVAADAPTVMERTAMGFVKDGGKKEAIADYVAKQQLTAAFALRLEHTILAVFALKERGIKIGNKSFLAALRDELIGEEVLKYVATHDDDKETSDFLSGLGLKGDETETKTLKLAIASALALKREGVSPGSPMFRPLLAEKLKQTNSARAEEPAQPSKTPKITQQQFMDCLAVLQAGGLKLALQILPGDDAKGEGVTVPLLPASASVEAQAKAGETDAAGKAGHGQTTAVAAQPGMTIASATASEANAAPPPPAAADEGKYGTLLRKAKEQVARVGINLGEAKTDTQKKTTADAAPKTEDDADAPHVNDYYRTYVHQGVRVVSPYYVDTSATPLTLKRNSDYKGYIEWDFTNSWAWNPARQKESAAARMDDGGDWSDSGIRLEPDAWRNGFDYHIALGANFGSKSKPSAATVAGEGDINAQLALEKHLYRGVVPDGGAFSLNLGTSLSLSTDAKNLSVHRSFVYGLTSAVSFDAVGKKERALLQVGLGRARYDNVQFVDTKTFEVTASRDNRPYYRLENSWMGSASLIYPYGVNKFIIFGGNVGLNRPQSIAPWSFWIGVSGDLSSVVKAFAPTSSSAGSGSSDKKDGGAGSGNSDK